MRGTPYIPGQYIIQARFQPDSLQNIHNAAAADAGVSLPELTAGVCRKPGKLSGLTVNVCRGSATRHTLQLRSG